MPVRLKFSLVVAVSIAIFFAGTPDARSQDASQLSFMLKLDRTAYLDPVGLTGQATFRITAAPIPVLSFQPPYRRLASSFAQACIKVPGVKRGMYLFPGHTDYFPEKLVQQGSVSIAIAVSGLPLSERQPKYVSHQIIGYDALLFFTNIDNPIDSLSVDQLTQIYEGRITNWKELGGHDEPIQLFGHRDIHQTQLSAIRSFLGLNISGVTIKKDYRQKDSSGDVTEWTDDAEYDNSSGALGFALRISLLGSESRDGIKILKIENISPSADSIRSGQYRPSLPVFALYLSTETQPNILNFVGWMAGPQGQAVLEECGLVSAHAGN